MERYNRLGFAGLGTVDLRLSDVALDDVFVRLTLTVEKVVREPIPPEEREDEQRRRSPLRRGDKEDERPRERSVTVQEPISLTDALTKNALIVGEPGAGKSTLLRWLAVTFAMGSQREEDRLGMEADVDRLPILVELGRLPDDYLGAESRETPNWKIFLPKCVTTQPPFDDIPAALLAQALAAGRCLLLCDGLDEIADLSVRRRIADSLTEYVRNSANRLVLSSRPAGASGGEGALGSRFQRLTIQRLTPEDVKQFFRFWYAQDSKLSVDEQRRQADALFARVQAAPKTLDLAAAPLLATLLVIIWRNEGNLPERRVELYERCSRMLIESWEAHHDVVYTGVLRDIGWERHLRLVAPLAYAIHGQGQRTDAGAKELVPVLVQAMQDEGLANAGSAQLETERFLSILTLRSGLLQFRGDDRYGFPHLAFQEYLTARHIASQPDPDYIDLVMAHLHEAWWREVHILVIGHLGSKREGAEKASQLILFILQLYRPPWRILRARRVRWWDLLAVASRSLAARVNWQLERRLAWMLAREYVLVSASYLDCTSLAADAGLAQFLSQQAECVFLQIVLDPGRYEKDGITPLVSVANNLVQLGQASPEVIPALLGALRDSDSDVREVAARSLVQLGQASPELMARLVVMAALVRTLDDYDSDVRVAAAHSLVQLGQTSPEVMVALVRASGEGSWRQRAAAVDSLRQLGQTLPEAAAALVGALRNHDSDVRVAAAHSLVQLGKGSPEAVALLMRALSEGSSDQRAAAARSLGPPGQASPEVVAALVRALNVRDDAVRQATGG